MRGKGFSMSECRADFEKQFPVPKGIYWNEISEQYDALPGAAGFDEVEIYHGQWMGWQAARAQGDAELVEYACHSCGNEAPPPAPYKMYVKCLCGAATAATVAADLAKQNRPPSAGVPSRDELISLLLATQNESEGVTADFILGMINRKQEGSSDE